MQVLEHPQPPAHREVAVEVGRNCCLVFRRITKLAEAATIDQALDSGSLITCIHSISRAVATTAPIGIE